tara:strand:+ start:2094 stop:2339 length:246 start_codon:yes stop_codon:yes gene_type:complete
MDKKTDDRIKFAIKALEKLELNVTAVDVCRTARISRPTLYKFPHWVKYINAKRIQNKINILEEQIKKLKQDKMYVLLKQDK